MIVGRKQKLLMQVGVWVGDLQDHEEEDETCEDEDTG